MTYLDTSPELAWNTNRKTKFLTQHDTQKQVMPFSQSWMEEMSFVCTIQTYQMDPWKNITKCWSFTEKAEEVSKKQLNWKNISELHSLLKMNKETNFINTLRCSCIEEMSTSPTCCNSEINKPYETLTEILLITMTGFTEVCHSQAPKAATVCNVSSATDWVPRRLHS